MGSPRLTHGRMVAHFERAFAAYLGRRHAVSVASGTLGTFLALRALISVPATTAVSGSLG